MDKSLFHAILVCVTIGIQHAGCGATNRTAYHVPDEQRLYRDLMWGYETSVRPVINANHTVMVHFQLTLNQITDLDERSQVLTTNVFIDQTWTDENLAWNPKNYNNIRTLRLPDDHVWLPDTFLFNNADDGSTGFMKGMYVLIYYNGTVLWPVPVKLKSLCKVDIRYFPFDDQFCEWRFGSWIYSGYWIDFSLGKVDLENFIDNSEWELLKIEFHKRLTNQTTQGEGHPDLHFTLHIRRRTLYYIFNIIAPCVMLSVLTLLTFWLPTTSGEKISLGLSVFLAFSMFMLLIAEEVPATSESVPLIGIYLTTVMTMTSVSVIMAVMVINLYNRGAQALHAPKWLRVLILEGLSRILCLKHDIEKITDNIKLDKDEEAKYACVAHPPILSRRSRYRRPSYTATPPSSPKQESSVSTQNHFRVKVTPKHSVYDDVMINEDQCAGNVNRRNTADKDIWGRFEHRRKSTEMLASRSSNKGTNIFSNSCCHNNKALVRVNGIRRHMPSTVIPQITITSADEDDSAKITNNQNIDKQPEYDEELSEPESPIWRKRDSVIKRENEMLLKKEPPVEQPRKRITFAPVNKLPNNNNDITTSIPVIKVTPSSNENSNVDDTDNKPVENKRIPLKVADVLGTDDTPCPKKTALLERRQIVVEWQTIATVIDRLLFWIFLVGTLVAYFVILFVIPYTKPDYPGNEAPSVNFLYRSRSGDMVLGTSVVSSGK